MVGCNEDAWRTTSVIWFENAGKAGEYGAAFTGSRQVGNNRTAPQSGMNEAGLVFSRLAAYYPRQNNPFPNRLKITDEVDYLSDILHTCSTIEEVKSYIEQYDHSVFRDDVYIYIDRSGKYLVVEPYALIEGNDAHYVLSNFCPSITANEQARKLVRYRNGEDYLKAHPVDASLAFCSALSDTMHVCRNRNGDGTLLTSIWDSQELLVNLYFYHQYDTTVQFNLKEELSKGNHRISIPGLFPENPEFKRLATYKTPFNTPFIRAGMVPLAGILVLFAFIVGVWQFRHPTPGILRLMPLINGILIAYLFVLATNPYIFYFDAPYQHHGSVWITASSYTPFVVLLAMFPLLYFGNRWLKSGKPKPWVRNLLISNYLIYILLILGFAYWGLYSIWN